MRYFITLFICFICHQASMAEMYKWVDDAGRIHYSDKPVDQQKMKKIDNARISIVKPPGTPKQVIMYSVESCDYCKKAARWMSDNRIAFVEYDIDKNLKARNEYRKLGKTITPVIKLGNKIITGFGEASKREIKAFMR